MLANLANLADCAYRALILCVILRAVESTLLIASSTIYRRMASGADLELRELVELNLHSIVRITLALRFCLFGLNIGLACCRRLSEGEAYALYDLGCSAVCQYPVGKAEGGVVVLASQGQVHGIEQGQLTVWNLNLRNSEIRR